MEGKIMNGYYSDLLKDTDKLLLALRALEEGHNFSTIKYKLNKEAGKIADLITSCRRSIQFLKDDDGFASMHAVLEEYAELLNKWAEFPALSQRILLGLNEEKARSLLNYAMVRQFNLQAQRVHIARRTDLTAQRRAEVARKLYILGQSTVLDLNASITEKDSARRTYLSALHEYWSMYYTLRSLTLYDFERGVGLQEDLERLIK